MKHTAVMQLLLEKGADIETKGDDPRPLLLRPTCIRHPAVIKLTLTKSAGFKF
jgi:hypothetical protein